VTATMVQGQQAGHLTEMPSKGLSAGHIRNGSNAHVMIAVDSVYPADMVPSIDDGRFSPDKQHGVNGAYYANGAASGKGGGQYGQNGYRGNEPVVDLSVPVHQPTRDYHPMALSAPRQGQDIFDTWCALLLRCCACSCWLHAPSLYASCSRRDGHDSIACRTCECPGSFCVCHHFAAHVI
jgi:hypothetical protein